MDNITKQNQPTRICGYTIACSDMYYSELEQRDVFVQDDPEKGFQIWAEIRGGGTATATPICQAFLEYAMYCHGWGSMDESIYNMQEFGNQLGQAIAGFMQKHPPAQTSLCKGACALLCVLEAMKVQLSVEHIDSELRFIFADCPLTEVARQTGLREIDLALYGVNAMCQSLINAIDPELTLYAPPAVSPNFAFVIDHVS